MREMERAGETAVAVVVDGQLLGVIGIADTLKSDAGTTVRALEQMGVQVFMMTGDNHRTAASVARSLGIDSKHVLSEVLPKDKAAQVKALQLRGHVVAMVGDGINDSPALAQADVGMAIGSGSEIAIEAADVVLVRNDVFDVCVAMDLSRTVFRRIRLNFFWAMGYNVVGIPIAAGVLYPFLHVGLPPEFAGLAMVCSSISVVLSSLALRWYKAPTPTSIGTRRCCASCRPVTCCFAARGWGRTRRVRYVRVQDFDVDTDVVAISGIEMQPADVV